MNKMLSLVLALTLLTGCSGKPAVSTPNEPAPPAVSTGAVKTGLSIQTDVSNSISAAAEDDGAAQADVTLVAVTVRENGVIDDCVIDMMPTKISFDAAGQLTTAPNATFYSKNELDDEYGMKKASAIGREWDEQAEAMAEYAVGKTVSELKNIAVDDKGAPAADVDLSASVTISIGGFLSGIEDAVNNAMHLGAQVGDDLELASVTDISKSTSASAEEIGLAQADVTAAAVTYDDDVITSCTIDAVQAAVNFDTAGMITSDLTAEQPSKNEQGDNYGMKKASAIGKEWYEQAAAFCAYVTGKTAEEVAAIAVDERTAPADADLAASVTIRIGGFQKLIAKTDD